ncbi:hypothetical protein ACIRP2_12375 [Streptomyces sp. NPDC101194]|uniref:hypothetical protein n=1 Tax=Streptomyces sp. NPDC101194 TaxID=3366127 RepID=UPI003818820D
MSTELWRRPPAALGAHRPVGAEVAHQPPPAQDFIKVADQDLAKGMGRLTGEVDFHIIPAGHGCSSIVTEPHFVANT